MAKRFNEQRTVFHANERCRRMKVLIASDIFGATPELSALAKEIHEDARVLSPYAKPDMTFGCEEEAYAFFLHTGGVEAYAKKISSVIAEWRPDAIVAFSAGATAAWCALAEPDLTVRLGVLFYGSRIRDYLNLRPAVPVKLIFAEHEKAFAVAPLITVLREQGVDADMVPGTRHGYMNRRSSGFDAGAMQEGLREAIGLLARLDAIQASDVEGRLQQRVASCKQCD